jgi:uncharacterized lipoprotein YddW (UPF0748 family)
MRRLKLLAAATALTLGLLSSAGSAQTPEIRAYWVDAFHNGIKTPADCDALLAAVRASHMNTIVVQVRKRGNTYYPSSIDPWAPDADPTFDALAYLIDIAHNQSPTVEVHAWFAMMPIWNNQLTPPEDPTHVYNTHPEWLTQTSAGTTWDGSNYSLDPGVPEAAQYTVDVLMDVVNRYALDGIHYDYVRYSGNTWGYNPRAVSRFNALYNRSGTPTSTNADWLQFRRDQITALVRKLYVSAIAVNPDIKVSAATITWGNGPATESAWYSTAAYSSVLQDWRSWMEEGILDVNMPMTYYDDSLYAGYFDNWIAYEKSHKYDRHLSIGLGGYLNTFSNVFVQLEQTRTAAGGFLADGQQIYSYAVPYSGGDGQAAAFAANLVAGFYPTVVDVPEMPWKSTPSQGHLAGTVLDCGGQAALDGATVSMTGSESRSTVTDGTGFYAFVDLAPGSYNVSVTYPGLAPSGSTAAVTAGLVTSSNYNLCAPPTTFVITEVAQKTSYGGSTADQVEILCVHPSGCSAYRVCDGPQFASESCSANQAAMTPNQRVVVSRGTSISTSDYVWIEATSGVYVPATQVGTFNCANGKSRSRLDCPSATFGACGTPNLGASSGACP